ncbi:polysaccharide deacetylase family protein [Mesorhizobium sp. CO1-1-7]|uniref:polysaccharide deacetylase family protein n=1 Tax=unclassified Mesorhizobium TaxID=325217 RepID=UPI0011275BDE|nr:MULTISPECIES: polysaccharide deacetylase family protein [unclassified Mesorhizobium]MBZ9932846.1 polysaccharide deacetylase family protein [Mesorhizobium sp. BR1-1-5]MBZ9747801.1 polysaccharide deacetylase family protein [Mesorhizobium sp. CO1-1-7]MBZ9905426.1 polysaccharide deacetylase family protein [Mesorhizobium sp. BR115XR7A]TPJ13867.1 polysaccharide deacetylase [Mesorhizobium sp. B2-7-3]TPK73699.1 polysaccharide deacetylase [Mesorhizobium sp. B2-4-18]
MTSCDRVWQPLVEELAGRQRAGRKAEFWLRDDDAVDPTPALDRLLDLTGEFTVPVTLAVIPALTDEKLAARLDEAPHATVAMHGWVHRNHAPEGHKKQELGAHRPGEAVLEELAGGLSHLTGLHGARTVPMLVPPWNRIDAGLVSDLGSIGFAALSVFGPPDPASLAVINCNVDIMDWHGTRGCRDHGLLIQAIVARLQDAFDDEPVGLLTHHLVHDESAWLFLERLFTVTAQIDSCVWLPIRTLIGRCAGKGR